MTNTPHVSFAFGNTPEIADDRLARVISGSKTATSEPVSSFDNDSQLERPFVGMRFIVLDGAGRPGAIIETIRIKEIRYDQVDESHAKLEGYASLADWAKAHKSDYCRDGSLVPDMMVLCQNFRLVDVLKRD